MRHIYIASISLLTFGLFLAAGLSRADHLGVVPAEQQELARRLAPAPVQDGAHGPFFQGRILRTLAPADPKAPFDDPRRYATLLVEGYGPGGGLVSRKPTLISALYLRPIVDELDTLEDLTRLFSGLPGKMGSSFADASVRAAFYGWVDPRGEAGLPASTAPSLDEGDFGAVDSYLRQGWAAYQERTAVVRAAGVPDPRTQLNLGSEQQHLEGMVAELVAAVARSGKYPGFERSFHESARGALILLHGLALAAPDLVADSARPAAQRMADLGRAAITVLSRQLRVPPVPLPPETLRYEAYNLYNPSLPLDRFDLARASAEVIAEGPPLVFIEDEMATSATLFEDLFELADGESHQGSELGGLAVRGVENLVGLGGGGGLDPALFEIDRDRYRERLHSKVCRRPDQNSDLALRLMHSAGWTPYDRGTKTVEDCLRGAIRAMSNLQVGAAVPEIAAANVQTLKGLIAAAGSLQESERATARRLVQQIDERIREIRDAVQQGYGEDAAFLALWDSL